MTDLHVQRTISVLDLVREHDAGRHEQLTADCVVCERDIFREHSITLNTIAWSVAVALGDVAEDAEQLSGDPVEQADRLIGKLAEARRLLLAADGFLANLGEPPTEQDLAEWFFDVRAWAGELLPNVTEVVEIRE